MIQDLLDDPDAGDILVTPADKRRVTPLFWEHALPYGEVKLNMTMWFPRNRGGFPMPLPAWSWIP